MYAVIETGGKQYKVQKGDKIKVEKIESEPGTEHLFDKVLLVSSDGQLQAGTPYLEGFRVTAKVLCHIKSKKIIVFKFKKRKNYRRKRGHRQMLTLVEILDIGKEDTKWHAKEQPDQAVTEGTQPVSAEG